MSTTTAAPTPLVPGYNKVDNFSYHADRTHLSSTVLKTLYKDPALYYDEYILGNKKPFANQAALTIGSLTHTMILEPHMRDKDYLFSPAWRRNELKHKEFMASLSPDERRTVVTQPENENVKKLMEAYYRLPAAVELMKDTDSEHTLCTTIDGVRVKARFDAVNIEKGLLLDIKTTGRSSDTDSFKQTCADLSYDISAALYLAVAEEVYQRPFDFYFIVLSKADHTCDLYKTSYDTRIKGMKKVRKALENFKRCTASGIWQSETPAELTLKLSNYEIQEI